jgi:hypothetical protein
MSNSVRVVGVFVFFALLIVMRSAAIAQYTFTVPAQSNYYRNPPVLYPNRAAILGQTLEPMNDIRQQSQDTSQYAANQRQLYLADQEARARYLQQQNAQRLLYQQQLQIQQQQQQFQQQYGYANSTPTYPAPRAPMNPTEQNQFVQRSYNQYLSRQTELNQWGQVPLPPPNYAPARRICSNGQLTWFC